MQQIFALPTIGILQLLHFLPAFLLAFCDGLTTSSYLVESLNGSRILRAFQVLEFGPSSSCNMLRARRRRAIDGEKIQGPRAEEGNIKTGQKIQASRNRSTQNQIHPDFTTLNLHCLNIKNIGFIAPFEA